MVCSYAVAAGTCCRIVICPPINGNLSPVGAVSQICQTPRVHVTGRVRSPVGEILIVPAVVPIALAAPPESMNVAGISIGLSDIAVFAA
jgi:hypothetical protein